MIMFISVHNHDYVKFCILSTTFCIVFFCFSLASVHLLFLHVVNMIALVVCSQVKITHTYIVMHIPGIHFTKDL